LRQKANGKEQPDRPSPPIGREIRGILFLLAAVVLGGSLFSYSPSDQLLWTITGPLGKSHNLFGTAGAHIAGGIFLVLGLSGFWLLVVLLALSLMSFRGVPLSSPLTSIIATVALLVSFAAMLDLQFSDGVRFKNQEMLAGAGGLAGHYVAHWTKNFLNHFGAYVFLAAIFLISLMVLTRLSLGWLFSMVGYRILGFFRRAGEGMQKRKERKQRAQKTKLAREKMKVKPKVTIISEVEETVRVPEQETFPFMSAVGEFNLPTLDLLGDPPDTKDVQVHRESLEMNARRLERKLADFGVEGEVIEILPGPVITMYEFRPAPGVKISKVAGLADDLALALRAPSIRIVTPLPGKAAIGIEIPNNQRRVVYLKEVLSTPVYRDAKYELPIALGKDITGGPIVTDLTKMPHLLVAGATGTGKSVSINTMINSLLFKVSPDITRFLLVDPKRIELSIYHDIPHLLHPVVTEPKDATRVLAWAVNEMERRYRLLSDLGVRNISAFNRKVLKERKVEPPSDQTQGTPKALPYIVIIIDELADLMMASSREVEESITRLAQMARAAGIHLVIATQRPSVDVLTGIIKANFPARISFQVSSRVDSRTILDTIGAETLLGEGDMLFMPPGVGRIMRIHGAYVSEEDVKAVSDFLRTQKKPDYDQTILSEVSKEDSMDDWELDLDEKYEQAVELVLQTGQASISMLQRRLRVGYNRAARMIEHMEKEGIVGSSDGVRPREVYGRKES